MSEGRWAVKVRHIVHERNAARWIDIDSTSTGRDPCVVCVFGHWTVADGRIQESFVPLGPAM